MWKYNETGLRRHKHCATVFKNKSMLSWYLPLTLGVRGPEITQCQDRTNGDVRTTTQVLYSVV